MPEHNDIQEGEIHHPFQWIVADAAARIALSTLSGDVYKLCLQTDTGVVYRLVSITPSVWEPIVDITAHTDDTTSAHAASAILNTPAGNIAATDVQAALNELDAEKQSAAQVASSIAAHADLAVDAHAATAIIYTPGVGLSATNVDAALDELAILVSLAARAADHIGTAGTQGFGVGICSTPPAGMAGMAGNTDPASDNYGNYQYSDGSVMVWIPGFYYRIGHVDSQNYATYAGNAIDIAAYSVFADVAAANAAGYALHRAFYDGGAIKSGFFVDKYQASNNGGVASSIRNGNPLSTNSAHNPIGSLTGLDAADNIYGGVFEAAKTRGPVFFPLMRYQFAALALLAMAHGQAATSATHCAWYDPALAINFPKGNNNNALKDVNDTAVTYVSDGYSSCGKTGSGTPFAKTTHNGQNCGVADLNGNMWEVSPGLTCIAGSVAITAATQANPVRVTAVAHGRTTGNIVQIGGVVGMTQINDKLFAVTVIDANTLTLDGCDGTAFTAYTSGGTLNYGTFYALSTSYAAKNLTGGNTLASDQWGATGVAAHSAALPMTLRTDYPENGFEKRFGRGANAVLDAATSGDGWARTAMGLPLAAGISDGVTGSNLFGTDRLYQYLRNELCPFVGGYWANSPSAGAWAVNLLNARADSSVLTGFRAASYL